MNMRKIDIIKPAVPKTVLLVLAALAWFCVGTMLLVLACRWLSDTHSAGGFLYGAAGIAAGLLVHRFGFQKIAAKNIRRILPIQDKRCVFSFFTWRSYLIIVIMVTMGRMLRHSAIPKPWLAIVYTTIGLALLLSSFKYLKVFIHEIKTIHPQSQ